MCLIPNGFWDTAIWMYNHKIIDKKEILRVLAVSNTGIYCSSDRVGTFYNKCSKIPPSTSMHFAARVKTWRVVRLSASWRSYDRTKLPRPSVNWITKTTRGYSFGYTDCYVLSGWRIPFSLYPTRDATSQWHFPNRWIGRGSTVDWPPRSPDLTPLDFCLWGLMKSEVYRKKMDTRDELLVNTLDVIACIKERQDALWRTTRHVFTPVAKCIDVDGGIFENLL